MCVLWDWRRIILRKEKRNWGWNGWMVISWYLNHVITTFRDWRSTVHGSITNKQQRKENKGRPPQLFGGHAQHGTASYTGPNKHFQIFVFCKSLTQTVYSKALSTSLKYDSSLIGLKPAYRIDSFLYPLGILHHRQTTLIIVDPQRINSWPIIIQPIRASTYSSDTQT